MKKKSSPLFSIIIPVYKVEKYLRTCVDTVLAQDYEDFEILLIDDGSPDSCPQICDEYALKDHRIKVIHKNNGGLSDARNYGIKNSSGKYILFLDGDDYWQDKDFLSGLYEIVCNQQEVDIVIFGRIKYFQKDNYFLVDKRDLSIEREIQTDNINHIAILLKHDLYTASATDKCVKSKFILQNNLFFKNGIRSEDIEWSGRLLYFMPSMACYNKKAYVYRRQVDGSITSNVDDNHINDIIQTIRAAISKSNGLADKERYIYLSYFAVQYLTLLYNISSNKFKKLPLLNDVKELSGILKYDINYKVKIANKIMKIFGFKLMTKLLRLYVQNKKV